MTTLTASAGAQQLRQYVERIERLNQEKASLTTDINDIYKEAAATGFDKKALREVIKLRAMDTDQRTEQDMLIESYRTALGLLS